MNVHNFTIEYYSQVLDTNDSHSYSIFLAKTALDVLNKLFLTVSGCVETKFLLDVSKIHRANVGPTLGRQEQGGPHVGHTNLAIWVALFLRTFICW